MVFFLVSSCLFAQNEPARIEKKSVQGSGLVSVSGKQSSPKQEAGEANGAVGTENIYRNATPTSVEGQQRLFLGQKLQDAGIALPSNFYTLGDAELNEFVAAEKQKLGNGSVTRKPVKEAAPTPTAQERSERRVLQGSVETETKASADPAKLSLILQSDFDTFNPEKKQHVLDHPEL